MNKSVNSKFNIKKYISVKVNKKRNKIYSKSGLWIDTKPLYINTLNLSLIEYKES